MCVNQTCNGILLKEDLTSTLDIGIVLVSERNEGIGSCSEIKNDSFKKKAF